MHEVDSIIYSFGGHKLSKQTIPPSPPKKKKKKKKKKKEKTCYSLRLSPACFVFCGMPWF